VKFQKQKSQNEVNDYTPLGYTRKITDLSNVLSDNSSVNTVQYATIGVVVFSLDPTYKPILAG
jgi:hypothetical protein